MKKFLSMAVAIAACVLLVFSSKDVKAAEVGHYEDGGYTVNGTTVTVDVTPGGDISTNLDNALDYAGVYATSEEPITVVIPKGSYKISDPCHIFSNTTLSMEGVTLTETSTSGGNILFSGMSGTRQYKGVSNYNTSSACSGYNGFENIIFEGGTKGGSFVGKTGNNSSLIRLAHATNVKFTNITFSGGSCAHQMEVAAIDGFTMTGCTFKDLTPKDAGSEKCEALQLDIPCHSDVFPSYYEDGTPNKNVTITKCTFSNVPRGVGSHTMLKGAYNTNIKINNNTFKNITEEAIVCLNYQNVELKDNTITKCGAGILFQYFKADTNSVYTTIQDGKKAFTGEIQHNAKATITGNNITTVYNKNCDEVQGIKLYGVNLTTSSKGADGKKVPTGNYYVSGITVTGNTITTAGFGIHAADTRSSTIANNTIVGSGYSSSDKLKDSYDGIFVTAGSKTVDVSNNKINSIPRYGIMVMEKASVTSITHNIIKNNGTNNIVSDAIRLYNKAECGVITENEITNAKYGGITISTSSTAGNITKNELTGVKGDAAINIIKKSTAGKIQNNIITNMGKDKKKKYCPGIKLTETATSGTISGNKVTKTTGTYSCGYGVLVYKSKVKGSISNNKIENSSDNSISVTTSSTVTGSINNNTIKKSNKSGVFVYKSSNVKKDVASNTITNPKDHGVYLSTKASVIGAIDKNIIKKPGKKGILVYDEKKANSTIGAITNNTITSSKKQAIHIYSIKNKVTISGNKISGVKENNILIEVGSTKYTITLKKNTIKGASIKGFAGIRVMSGKININNNTISNIQRGVYTSAGVKGKIYSNKISKVKDKIFCESKKGLTFKK